jgi:hypothetical protein
MFGPRDNPEGTAGDAPWLELSLARLRVVGDELVRLNAKGNPVLRLRLGDVEEVYSHPAFDPMSALFLTGALGAAAVGRFVSESNTLTVLLYLAAFAGVLLAILACVRQQIVLRAGGKTLVVNCPDAADEVAGFATSLTAELVSRKADPRPLV